MELEKLTNIINKEQHPLIKIILESYSEFELTEIIKVAPQVTNIDFMSYLYTIAYETGHAYGMHEVNINFINLIDQQIELAKIYDSSKNLNLVKVHFSDQPSKITFVEPTDLETILGFHLIDDDGSYISVDKFGD